MTQSGSTSSPSTQAPPPQAPPVNNVNITDPDIGLKNYTIPRSRFQLVAQGDPKTIADIKRRGVMLRELSSIYFMDPMHSSEQVHDQHGKSPLLLGNGPSLSVAAADTAPSTDAATTVDLSTIYYHHLEQMDSQRKISFSRDLALYYYFQKGIMRRFSNEQGVLDEDALNQYKREKKQQYDAAHVDNQFRGTARVGRRLVSILGNVDPIFCNPYLFNKTIICKASDQFFG